MREALACGTGRDPPVDGVPFKGRPKGVATLEEVLLHPHERIAFTYLEGPMHHSSELGMRSLMERVLSSREKLKA